MILSSLKSSLSSFLLLFNSWNLMKLEQVTVMWLTTKIMAYAEKACFLDDLKQV